MSETPSLVLCERRGAIGLLTINRPKTLNALSVEALLALQRYPDAEQRLVGYVSLGAADAWRGEVVGIIHY